MNKADFVSKVAEALDTTKVATNPMVEAVLDEIVNALVDGDTVEVAGFGKFEVVERAARVGHNPKTMEPIEIPAKKAVKFTPYSSFKDAVNQ